MATGKKPRRIPMLDAQNCTGCETCVQNCVKGAITPVPGRTRRTRS